jgi:hypothetical protein
MLSRVLLLRFSLSLSLSLSPAVRGIDQSAGARKIITNTYLSNREKLQCLRITKDESRKCRMYLSMSER